MRIDTKKIICLAIIGLFLISTNAYAFNLTNQNKKTSDMINIQEDTSASSFNEDHNPFIDLKITIHIKEIRALDKIDLIGDPDFYVKIFVNDQVIQSDIWRNQKYVKETWSTHPIDVPDEIENVNIKIQLWDWNPGKDKLCDIGSIYNEDLKDKRDIDLIYSLKSGHWRGDDFNTDDKMYEPSGYGRANGCDDGSYNQKDRDCELLFDITQNDNDGDNIPYWTEVNVYGTDPEVNNSGEDADEDGIPIDWEHRWGHYFYRRWHEPDYFHAWIYDPFEWDDHENLDPDEDGLQNIEEYLTSQWGSDPFRQDIFLEVDQMEKGPAGQGNFIPDLSKELLRDAFSKRNILFLVDDGCMGGGQKDLPFDANTTDEELQELYFKYFLNNDTNNWRRGVFHYCLIIYHSARYPGFAFGSNFNGYYLADCLQLSTDLHDVGPVFKYPIINLIRRKSLDLEYHRAVGYASVMMHETGHILGIHNGNTPGCDARSFLMHFKYRKYMSCMNYLHVYYLIDYSDGSNGKNDFDDWDRIDLTRFQIKHYF